MSKWKPEKLDREEKVANKKNGYQTDRDAAVRRGVEIDVICLPDTT